MADLSITAGNVAFSSGAQPQVGVAGETITAGQPIYYDASVPGWMKGKSNVAAKKAPTAIALTGASAAGYFLYAVPGTVIAIGATIVKGIPYYLSGAAAGGIAPVADLTVGWDTVVVGFGQTTTTLAVLFVSPGITN